MAASIAFHPDVCGGSARVSDTRIPVWTLETARRQGMTDDAILAAFPVLTAKDLAAAWEYAENHRPEMDREIAANDDD